MKFFNTKQNKGFTLVEALVAISILTLSITAAFSAAQTGLQTSNIAKNQITAFYLAQDAFEYIRNARDTEKLVDYKNGWNNFIDRFSSCGEGCAVDTAPDEIRATEINFISSKKLYNRDGIYTHNSVLEPPLEDTVYTREVKFQTFENSVSVTVKVTWTQGVRTMNFEAEDLLTNWQ